MRHATQQLRGTDSKRPTYATILVICHNLIVYIVGNSAVSHWMPLI